MIISKYLFIYYKNRIHIKIKLGVIKIENGFYKEMDNLHDRLISRFYSTKDSRYLGAANCLAEAINYIIEVENILTDKDPYTITPSILKTVEVNSDFINRLFKKENENEQ